MVAAASLAGGPSTWVAIPGGLWGDVDAPVRQLPLRAVGGEDEAFLVEAESLAPVERANALLARCLDPAALGPGSDPAGIVASLTIGDREAAFLHLRKLSLGDRLDAVLTCPDPACGERLEVELDVDDLLVAPTGAPQREHRARIGGARTALDVRFRLPTAGDLDAVTTTSARSPEAGADQLLRRCVLALERRGKAVALDDLGPADREAIAEAIAERDPQAEIELELACSTCGHAFSVFFDTAAYLLQELDARAARLLEDVHALALHYGWSERDILAIPAARRERYLALLARQASSGVGELALP